MSKHLVTVGKTIFIYSSYLTITCIHILMHQRATWATWHADWSIQQTNQQPSD